MASHKMRQPTSFSEHLQTILTRLDLCEFYPEKITLQNVMTICIEDGAQSTEQTLPWKLLRGIIMLDSSVRDTVGAQSNENESQKSSIDDIDAFLEDSFDDTACETIYPTDILLATFYCCSYELRQLLFQKLFMCKIAFPFVVPNMSKRNLMLNLWPLRKIVLEWCGSDGESFEETCISAPIHIVSAVRFGKVSDSKSRILNGLISDGQNQAFYNNSFTNASGQRYLDGHIEGAWFIPSGKDDKMKNVSLFFNLRGDAKEHTLQLDYIASLSRVVILMVDIKDLNESRTLAFLNLLKHKSKNFLIVIFNGFQIDKKNMKSILDDFKKYGGDTSTLINALSATEAKAIANLKGSLVELLRSVDTTTLEGAIKSSPQKHLFVDEDNSECKEGKRLALEVLKPIESDSLVRRTNVLPLHGDAWAKYSELLKDEKRFLTGTDKGDALARKDRIKGEIIQQRDNQRRELSKSMRVMKPFIGTMKNIIHNEKLLYFFLKWFQLKLDRRSRIVLPELNRSRINAYRNLRIEKDKKDASKEKLKTLTKKVEQCEIDLSVMALGIEHVFRELGQVYEAVMNMKEKPTDKMLAQIKDLPSIMAHLIIRGHTLEIMDGDVSNIPSLWITEVFKSLRSILGDKRVYVVSILGVQSSGKSTLLNTMFGIQFAVSAGRCTKGVYAQLMPVKPEVSSKLNYDYILVVDSEGLRAPELSLLKQDHDNELATLSLGLADVTIVNIKGENTTEMRDTLQIAMHAFLRMKMADKNLKSKQRCIFVHNNVSAIAAKDKMDNAQRKLEATLDMMIAEAASQVKCEEITSFRELLEFDIEKDVRYLSDLWRGDPPMAPVNPGYAKQVAEVKDKLTQEMPSSITTISKISHINLRIADLWEAILAEDFIFSFKNSIEARAYENVLRNFLEVKRELSKRIMVWVSEIAETKIVECSSRTKIGAQRDDTVQQMKRELDRHLENAKLKMAKCFDEGDLKDITIQWKTNKLNELDMCRSEIEKEALRRIDAFVDHRKMDLIQRHDVATYEEEMLRKSKEVAITLRSKELSDKELSSEFEKHWKVWSAAIPPDNTAPPRIDRIIIEVLRQIYISNLPLLNQELDRKSIDSYRNGHPNKLEDSLCLTDITSEDFAAKGVFNKFKNFFKKEDVKLKTFARSKEILQAVQQQLEQQLREPRPFRGEDVDDLVSIIQDRIAKNNNDSNSHMFLRPPLEIKLATNVCRIAYPMYVGHQRAYQNKHGIASKVKELKQMCFNFFKNAVKNSTIEIQTADMFCDLLKGPIKHKLSSQMPEKIKSSIVESLGTKHAVIVKIFEDLRKENDFLSYMHYIQNSASYAKKWLVSEVRRVWFTKHDQSSQLEDVWLLMMAEKISNLQVGLQNTKSSLKCDSPLKAWLDIYRNAVGKHVPIPEETFNAIEYTCISDTSNLKELIILGITRIKDELQCEYSDSSFKELMCIPYDAIMQDIWGCIEQCPFCAEPCCDTSKNHWPGKAHTCVQHRPEGLNGRYWIGTEKLVVETCSYHVQSSATFVCSGGTCHTDGGTHKYKEYRGRYKEWHIQPSAEIDSSKYWNWFMYKYQKDLKTKHGKNDTEIPKSWSYITEEDALKSL